VSHHGPSTHDLVQSSYKLQLQKYIDTSYPIGAQATLGVFARVLPGEVWQLYEPLLAFLVALLPLSLYSLLAEWVPRRWTRAAFAFVAAQPALVVSLALQGSIKEIATLPMLVLTAALVTRFVVDGWRSRALVALAVPAAASLVCLGPSATAYLAPMLALAAVVWVWRMRLGFRRSEAIALAAVVLVGVVLILPVIAEWKTAYAVNKSSLTLSEDLGNLAKPLNPGQVAGIWLNGDFRYLPSGNRYLLFSLIGVALAFAALGLIWAIRRRALGPLILIGAMGLTSLYLLRRGSAYADSKVLMLASPAVLLAAMLGTRSLLGPRRRLEAALAAAVLAGGVLVSNALAYHDVQLAPSDRYQELSRIDERLDGKGPTILAGYDEYGAYFLRDARGLSQPEWPHQYRQGVFLDPKRRPSEKTPIDPDMFSLAYLESVKAIVVQRSPTASRPPANFRRTFAGRYYDVWQRTGPRPAVLRHLPLGSNVFEPAGAAPCADVLRLAGEARQQRAELAYVARPRLAFVQPLEMVKIRSQVSPGPLAGRVLRVERPAPAGWYQYGGYPGGLVSPGRGEIAATVAIPAGGRFRLWLEGSFGRRVSVTIDGRQVGSVSQRPGNPGQYVPIGTADIAAGRHTVAIAQGGGDLRPGNGGSDGSLRHIGPLAFSPPSNETLVVRRIRPERARDLCGRWLDWVEVVAPRA
jgi:hypothetical protein